MAEYAREREREREAEARTNDHYEQAILRMRAERETQLNGQLVSKGTEWQLSRQGDLLLLPVKSGGVEHQHFNTGDSEDTHWIAFYYEPWGRAMGNLMEQVEETPEMSR
jgi:hypothetical protein